MTKHLDRIGVLYRLVVLLRRVGLNKIPPLVWMKRWLERRFRETQETATLRVHGRPFQVWADEPARISKLLEGRSEPFTTELFSRCICPGDTVLDVGAHVGYYSLLACDRVGSGGHVFAFEAEPRNAALLRKNLVLNGFENVRVSEVAVSDSSGTLSFGVKRRHTGGHSLFLGEDVDHVIEVPTICLDEWIREIGIDGADVMKVDVEGAEFRVVAGMHDTVARSSGLTLFIEVNPRMLSAGGASPEGLLGALRDVGFEKIFRIEEDDRRVIPIVNAEWPDSNTRNVVCIKGSGLLLQRSIKS